AHHSRLLSFPTRRSSDLVMNEQGTEASQMRYAVAVAAWGEAGGYDAEVLWDVCTVSVLGLPFERCRDRRLSTLSGGQQKRLALEDRKSTRLNSSHVSISY